MPPVLGMKFYKISKKLLSTGNKSKYQKKKWTESGRKFPEIATTESEYYADAPVKVNNCIKLTVYKQQYMSEFRIKKSYRSSESIRLWVGVVSDWQGQIIVNSMQSLPIY